MSVFFIYITLIYYSSVYLDLVSISSRGGGIDFIRWGV